MNLSILACNSFVTILPKIFSSINLAIIFSSGKTVSNAAFLLEKKLGKKWLEYFDQIKLLTIGPQTTKICHKIFGRVDCQAQKYTFEGLLDVAINIFN